MEDITPLSPIPQEAYVPQKLRAFMSEPQGCALVAALEGQFNCSINVVNDALLVAGAADVTQIEKILRDVWQKRDIQIMIREAALNVSCSHLCQMILPRAYCAVVFFFSADFQRRSRCSDIILDQFTGKVTIFGNEAAVCKARQVMIECLTEHFGPLEIEIPLARRTTRLGYGMPAESASPFNIFSVLSSRRASEIQDLQMGEPNAILTSTPPVESSRLNNHLLFPSDFSVPPPPIQEVPQKTNNVEKVKQWIPTSEVGKILGNRAAMKKQIEGQFKCVITVHTEVYSQFGMTSVEIMAQNKEQCQAARNAVLALMTSFQDKPADSGINSPASPLTPATGSPSTTPEKRVSRHFHHRSSFRDQPKVMLALTPRKTQPATE
uniref:KH domain-containing protein n=1 Tax=Caenorhabditis tropicalis TaxID=1561998 RepID=A0A1I7U4Y6_9PELO